MLLFSMLLCAVAFFQMFERTTNGFRKTMCGCSRL